MIRRPPRSTRTDTRFPYTTLFRSNTTTIEVGEVPVIGSVTFKNIFSTLRVLQNNVIREFGVSSLPSGVVINQYDIIGAYPNQQLVPSNEEQKSDVRSEERRVGKECVSTCRSRWSPSH